MKRFKPVFIIFLFLIFSLSTNKSISQILQFSNPANSLFDYNSIYFPHSWTGLSFLDNVFDFTSVNNFSYFPSYSGINQFQSPFTPVKPIYNIFSFGTQALFPMDTRPFLYNYEPVYSPIGWSSLLGYTLFNAWSYPQPYDYFGMNLLSGFNYQQTPTQEPPPSQQSSRLKTGTINLSNVQTDNQFIKKYYLGSLDMPLEVPQYDLPLKTTEVSNFSDFSAKISLSSNALNLLKNNGFVVIDNPFNPREEYITQPYKTLKNEEVPIFITTDSLLHLYHIQFDETLRQIEEREFYDKIWEISQELINDAIEKYNNTRLGT